jgi:hypothetical protein
VPAGGQRTGFGFAVADDAGDDQVGIVEGRTERVEAQPSSPPSWIDPGFPVPRWLRMPPGS